MTDLSLFFFFFDSIYFFIFQEKPIDLRRIIKMYAIVN